jgi:hypothetical protein
MKRTKVVTLKYAPDEDVLVSTPHYSQAFMDGIKDEEVFPRSDRKWEPPNWRVKAIHLAALRELVARIAEQEGWHFIDETAQSQEATQAQEQAIVEDFLDRHVAAVIAVLPKLPARSLRLVTWTAEHLEFELRMYLDNPALFKKLSAASLQSYRPSIWYGGSHKREFQRTFIVAADERILRALCTIAGTIPVNEAGNWKTKVEYFIVRPLVRTQLFEDGIAHFSGEDHSFWIGFPYPHDPIDINWSQTSWQVVLNDGKIYVVYKAVSVAKDLLGIKESQYVNPGIGNVAVAQSHSSVIARFIQLAQAEAWFKQWGNELVRSDQLTPSPFQKPRWYDWAWNHPADELLNQGSSKFRQGVSAMYQLLDWDEESVEAYRQHIQHLKETAAQTVIDEMRVSSVESALPLLQNLTIQELLNLGGKHQVELRKSWGKERIVQTLAASTSVCEDIIGLTKRLEGKQ